MCLPDILGKPLFSIGTSISDQATKISTLEYWKGIVWYSAPSSWEKETAIFYKESMGSLTWRLLPTRNFAVSESQHSFNNTYKEKKNSITPFFFTVWSKRRQYITMTPAKICPFAVYFLWLMRGPVSIW